MLICFTENVHKNVKVFNLLDFIMVSYESDYNDTLLGLSLQVAVDLVEACVYCVYLLEHFDSYGWLT